VQGPSGRFAGASERQTIYGDTKLMSKFNIATELVPFCGETKILNLDVMPNGKLSDVQHRLPEK